MESVSINALEARSLDRIFPERSDLWCDLPSFFSTIYLRFYSLQSLLVSLSSSNVYHVRQPSDQMYVRDAELIAQFIRPRDELLSKARVPHRSPGSRHEGSYRLPQTQAWCYPARTRCFGQSGCVRSVAPRRVRASPCPKAEWSGRPSTMPGSFRPVSMPH